MAILSFIPILIIIFYLYGAVYAYLNQRYYLLLFCIFIALSFLENYVNSMGYPLVPWLDSAARLRRPQRQRIMV